MPWAAAAAENTGMHSRLATTQTHNAPADTGKAPTLERGSGGRQG